MRYHSLFRTLLFSFAFFALSLIPQSASAADYSKPATALEFHVEAYNLDIAIWAAMTPVGHVVGVFEKLPTGLYRLCNTCYTNPAYPDFSSAVNSAGNVPTYIQNVILPQVNLILANKYPPLGGGPGSSIFDQVSYALSNLYKITNQNGTPVLTLK